MKSRFISNDEGCEQAAADIEYAKNQCGTLLDLTDDEVAKAYMECTGGDIIARCRAVIAADREKNK